MRRTTRLLASAASATTAAALLVLPGAPASAAGVVTDYAYATSGYGSEVRTAQDVVQSGKTAWSIIACTRLKGLNRTNRIAAADIPHDNPAVQIGAVESNGRTYSSRTRRAASTSTNHVARVRLGTATSPNLVLEGIRTNSQAWADRNGGLHARNVFRLADLRITMPGGAPVPEPLASLAAGTGDVSKALFTAIRDNGGRLLVPGLGVLKAGETVATVGRRTAQAKAWFLVVDLYGPNMLPGGGDDSTVHIGRTRAQVSKNVTAGVMGSGANGLTGSLVGGVAKLGRVVNQPLNCLGTGGKVVDNHTAGVAVPSVLRAGAIGASALGEVARDKSIRAWTRGGVADITLFPGTSNAITITGIVGKANIRTDRGGRIVQRNISGSRLGSLTFDGTEYALPKPGGDMPALPQELSALVALQPYVQEKGPRSVKVTALRITLLKGTAADSRIDLGNAYTKVTRS